MILEATARCKPVVSIKGGGVKEIISDRENGMLVEPNDSFALAEAIAETAADQKLAQTLAEKGFETVVNSY